MDVEADELAEVVGGGGGVAGEVVVEEGVGGGGLDGRILQGDLELVEPPGEAGAHIEAFVVEGRELLMDAEEAEVEKIGGDLEGIGIGGGAGGWGVIGGDEGTVVLGEELGGGGSLPGVIAEFNGETVGGREVFEEA